MTQASLSERLYAKLLRLYPPGYQRRYGPLMLQLFRDQYRDACSAGRREHWRLWWRVSAELPYTAGSEYVAEIKEAVMGKQIHTLKGARVMAMLLASVLIAGSLIGKSVIFEFGGSTALALVVLLTSHLVAGLIIDRVIEARGTGFALMALLTGATLLPLLWVSDGREWLRENPVIGGVFIIVLAGYYQTGRARWPMVVVAGILAAAQILVSFI
jgi:hypothetical protein